MGARKRKPVVQLNDADFEPSDLTDRTMPEGTPQNPDGTVASEGQVEPGRIRKIGAATADAAASNKRMARKIDQRAKGANVSWDEKDALILFDILKGEFGATALQLCIKDMETTVDHPPCQMSMFRTNMDLYKHMEKIQQGKTQRTYRIVFKDIGNYSNRGIAFITMPDMLEEPAALQSQQQQQPWMPPGPSPYGGGYGYPPPGYYGQPPPQQQQQQPPAAPPPAAPPPAQSMPYPQQQAPIVIPPGTDPATAQMMHAILQEQRESRNRFEHLTSMISGTLGANEEFRRMNMQLQHQQPQYQPPPPVQAAAPPPPAVDPYRTAPPVQPVQQQQPQQVFLGYGPNGQPVFGFPPGMNMPGQPAGPWNPQPQPPTQQPQGVGAPPPPPPPPPVAAIPARPQSPFQQMNDLAQTIAQAMAGLDAVKKAVGAPTGRAAQQQPEEEEEPENMIPPPPAPLAEMVKVTKLGDINDPDALMIAHKPDGAIDWPSTGMANLPKVAGIFSKAADAAARISHTTDEIQRTRPITVQAHTVPVQRIAGPPPPLPSRQ